jgi:hypothetical protein
MPQGNQQRDAQRKHGHRSNTPRPTQPPPAEATMRHPVLRITLTFMAGAYTGAAWAMRCIDEMTAAR